MTQPPELALLERVQNGEQDALVALHQQYINAVYAVAYRVLQEPMAAEECAQDTFLRLWDKAESYDPAKGKFVTWLLTIARRRAIDMYRQQQRHQPQTGLFSIDDEPYLWEQIPEREEQRGVPYALRAAVRDLPSEQAQVIELAYFFGMTHSDIAAYLGEPLGTIKTRLRLGMQKLRLAWQGGSNPDLIDTA